MGRKKRILYAAVVFLAAAMLVLLGAAESDRQGRFTGSREKKRYPSEAEAWRLAGLLPLACTPVSECYQKEEGEQGFSEELLAELQEYVRRGAYAEALLAYRDESLLIDVEELLRLCPDYEELIAEEIRLGRLEWFEGDILSGIVQIYALELDGEEGEELLIWQDQLEGRYGYKECPWIILKKTKDGYLVGEAYVGSLYGSQEEKTAVTVFAWGRGEEKTYYLLQKEPQERLWLEKLVLCEDWRGEMREDSGRSFYLFKGDGRYISRETTLAEPCFLYADGKAALTPAVKAYIEDNAALFACKLFPLALGNENTIWGDEEITELTQEEEKQIEKALTDYYRDIRGKSPDAYDYDIYYFMKYIVRADYDNDGAAELFFRDNDEKNILLVQEEDGYQTQYVNLYGEAEAPAAQMWFVEFDETTVTFEIALPYGEAYPILSAYLIEGEQRTPLITCQLVFGETIEVDTLWRNTNFKDCPRLSLLQEAHSSSFYEEEEIKAEVRENCANLQIQFEEAESPLPEEFLIFIREGERELLRGNFWQYLEPYQIDTAKDSRDFCAREDWGWLYYHRDFWWAYRWEAHGGSENFLIREDYYEMGFYEGTPGVARLCWFRDDGESHKEEELVRFSRHDSTFMVSYEGRTYCIVADTSLGVTGDSGIYVIALGEAGEWEGCYISLMPQTEAYESVFLDCGDTPAVVLDYVEAEYDNMLSACRNGESYAGRADSGIPAAAWRDIKNRDAYYGDEGLERGIACTYKAVDADNDGEAEYLAAYCDYDQYAYMAPYYPRKTAEYIMYGYRDGKFVELSLDTVEKDGAFAKNYGCSYEWDLGEGCIVRRYPQQLWFEELDGVTYFFTMELLAPTHSFLLRARVIKDGAVEEAGAWILSAPVAESVGACF